MVAKSPSFIETDRVSDIFHYLKQVQSNTSNKIISTVALVDAQILGQPTTLLPTGERQFVLAGSEATTTGITFTKEKVTLDPNVASECLYAHTIMGNVILNKTRLPENDVAGNPFDIDLLIVAYTAMGDVAIKEESVLTKQFGHDGNVA